MVFPLDRIRRRLAEGPRREGEFSGDGRDLAPPRRPACGGNSAAGGARQAPSVLLTLAHRSSAPSSRADQSSRWPSRADDASPVPPALRETEEEIGLAQSRRAHRRAADYLTGAGFA